MYTPHIGDTVIVKHPNCRNNGAETVPAIVVQKFDQSHNSSNGNLPILLNLYALNPFMTPQWLGSVPFFSEAPLIQDELFIGCWPKQERHHNALSAAA